MIWVHLTKPQDSDFRPRVSHRFSPLVIPSIMGKHHGEKKEVRNEKLAVTQSFCVQPSLSKLQGTQLPPPKHTSTHTHVHTLLWCTCTCLCTLPEGWLIPQLPSFVSSWSLHLSFKSFFHLHISSEERSSVGTLLLTLYFQCKF